MLAAPSTLLLFVLALEHLRDEVLILGARIELAAYHLGRLV